ncbi:MAG: hypothetical protein ACRDCT_22970 [Shewanella sp.]
MNDEMKLTQFEIIENLPGAGGGILLFVDGVVRPRMSDAVL